LDDVAAFITWMRQRFGDGLVSSRAASEKEAAQLLNSHGGEMTSEQAMQLGKIVNTGTWAAALRHNRFVPAFNGATMLKLIDPLDTFNAWTATLWKGSDEEAMAGLAKLVADRKLRPGAGSSYPSLLLYLRDPERHAVWTNSTRRGLTALGYGSVETKDVATDYAAFCEAVSQLRHDHGLAPQEVDAILAEAMRQSLPPAPTDPGESDAAGMPDVQQRLATAAAEAFLDAEVLEEWLQLLTTTGKQQLVFFGPPGTGKTFLAERLAEVITGPTGTVLTVQFHPSFGYEDFVEGLRPVIDPVTKQLTYQVVPGILRTFCEQVVSKTEARCAVVIDEMNRADLASVLGELMFLLEYRKKTVTLPYSKQLFALPSNLFILASMNTADRSLAPVDFALRRRFHAVRLPPDRNVLERYLLAREEPATTVLSFFDLVQSRAADKDYAPGHSFWMSPDTSPAALARMWQYQLDPYLAELWVDAPKILDALREDVAQFLADNT